jgi:multiple sugar transport system ATP-binding protein
MAEIAFRNVSKRFKDTLAVNDASFTVADNEFFCLFGPPLSGKSTILRLILGLETPDSGEILIDGKVVNAVSPAARNIAMVFQNLALFPHMSAADNVRFPLIERHEPKARIEARLMDAADKLHIGHILHKMPGQLSGGERQRVAIARALVRDPAAYLMDDPISALDARLREETRVELKRIQREAGRTLIYVTHDQEEAMSVADRMAILEQGAIRQIGTPVAIYDRPATTYVARFLGSPAMNILPAQRMGATFQAASGALIVPARDSLSGVAELGLRPEDLRVAAFAGQGQPATVTEVEPLGGYTVLTLNGGGQALRASLRGQPDIQVGAQVALTCDPSKVIYFAASGDALPRLEGEPQ